MSAERGKDPARGGQSAPICRQRGQLRDRNQSLGEVTASARFIVVARVLFRQDLDVRHREWRLVNENFFFVAASIALDDFWILQSQIHQSGRTSAIVKD